MIVRSLLIALMIACLPAIAHADPCEGPLPQRAGETFSGAVRYVGDGDSLCVGQSRDPGTWIEVRLADFHAPELNAAAGPAGKAALERFCAKRGPKRAGARTCGMISVSRVRS